MRLSPQSWFCIHTRALNSAFVYLQLAFLTRSLQLLYNYSYLHGSRRLFLRIRPPRRSSCVGMVRGARVGDTATASGDIFPLVLSRSRTPDSGFTRRGNAGDAGLSGRTGCDWLRHAERTPQSREVGAEAISRSCGGSGSCASTPGHHLAFTDPTGSSCGACSARYCLVRSVG